jgi:TIR domain
MKKIFFNYSDEAEDAKMMRNLCLHFSVLKDKVDLWHKGKILPGDTVDEELSFNLNNADAVLHLLSISYAAEDDCMELLDQGIKQDKNNIPVLLSSFDWQSVDPIKQLEEKLLPQDHKPVDVHPNYNEVYTEIVQTVKKDVLGMEGKAGSGGRIFYYILSALILAVGSLVTIWANNIFNHLGITLGVFALFVISAFLTIRKIIFPTSISTSKL